MQITFLQLALIVAILTSCVENNPDAQEINQGLSPSSRSPTVPEVSRAVSPTWLLLVVQTALRSAVAELQISR